MDENDITEIFGRINSGGKHLSAQERRQAGVTSSFAEVVRTIAMKLRGDDTLKTLHLFDMPQISIDSRQNHQGYGIQAEDILWCKQGILSASQLRDSQDEDMIADISASILLNAPLRRDTKRLDDLYDESSGYFREIENALALYGKERLVENIVKTFSILGETIEACNVENKYLVNLVNPGSSNPIPQAFYTIFMAFFDLIIERDLLPADSQKIMLSLSNLQEKLSLSRRYAKPEDRQKNINQTKGLIQDNFVRKDKSALGQGAELMQTLKNSLLRSRIETGKYECKQGLLDLSDNRKLNNDLLQRLIETICGIANSAPDADGYIFLGVVDKKQDADRIKDLDKVNPIEINERYIVGVDREAKVLEKTLEDYVKILIDTIRNSELTNPLKTHVLTKIDIINCKGLSIIRISIPSQKEVSFVGDIAIAKTVRTQTIKQIPSHLADNQNAEFVFGYDS